MCLILRVCFILLGVKVECAALREFAAVADGPGRGVLLFPEICIMELQLLATGSPDLEVLSHVFHSLLGAVHANRRNAALLYDQVRLTTSSSLSLPLSCGLMNITDPLFLSSQGGVKTILSGFHSILSQTDPSFTGLLFLLIFIYLFFFVAIFAHTSHTVGCFSCLTSRENAGHAQFAVFLRFLFPAAGIWFPGSSGFKRHTLC